MKKRLGKVYEWLVFLNIVFLAICAYKGATIIYNDDILMIVIVSLFSFVAAFMILACVRVGFMFILRCYTITGYKSIWLFIIGSFIPQIFCAVCSLIYFFFHRIAVMLLVKNAMTALLIRNFKDYVCATIFTEIERIEQTKRNYGG